MPQEDSILIELQLGPQCKWKASKNRKKTKR